MNRLSDRGSIPLRSIPEKPLKSSVLAVFLYIFDGKNRAKVLQAHEVEILDVPAFLYNRKVRLPSNS